MPVRLNPITVKKLRRFRALRRGFWSFVVLSGLIVFTLLAELFINNRALVVRHEGSWFFPAYADVIPGDTFNLGYPWETDYRQLRERIRTDPAAQARGDFILLATVPYSPTENTYPGQFYQARPPDWNKRHLLGTDTQNRDIFARLVYGFRKALIFSFWIVVGTYALGILIGCAMGYYRGSFDLVFQRIIEIWSNIPTLYVIIILASLVRPDLFWLCVITITFGWMGMTYYMRTGTLKEAARDYVASAQVLGASDARIILRHILPNTAATLVTFVPFTVAGAIGSLTALDFLGFGLPVPTPSWGELLQQGTQNLTTAPWIVISAVTAMTLVLTLVTFVGEAIREAFDPRTFTTYQ